MGIKKAQAPSIYPLGPATASNHLWIEVCAMERSFNVHLDLLVKSLSRSQFGRIIEQYKVVSL